MPPWNADEGFGELKQAHTLSPKELDIIMTWASGGNPRGSLDQKLPAVDAEERLDDGRARSGAAAAVGVHRGRRQDGGHAGVHAGHRLTEPRWVRAVDLLPGTPSIVRSAVISVKGAAPPATAASPRRTTCWRAGCRAGSRADRQRRRVPAAGRARELVARIHYKKTWQFEGKPLTDRSTVGVYFAQAAMRASC